jgi:hypothetical protein
VLGVVFFPTTARSTGSFNDLSTRRDYSLLSAASALSHTLSKAMLGIPHTAAADSNPAPAESTFSVRCNFSGYDPGRQEGTGVSEALSDGW